MHIPYPDDYYTAPPSYQSPISKFIRPPVVYVRIPISGYSVIGITDPTYILQPLYRAIAVYASMYICVFIAYDWMSRRMRTYAHSRWAGNTVSEFFPEWLATINTYKIKHCYTLLLLVSSAVQAWIRYQKGEKMDVYVLWGRMLCSCIHIGTGMINQWAIGGTEHSSTAWCQQDLGFIVDSGRRW